MNRPSSIVDIKEALTRIRNLREGFVSNFFLDPERHSLWIDKGVCHVVGTDRSVFIIKGNDGFCNLFYASTRPEILRRDLECMLDAQFPWPVAVIDVVGKTKDTNISQALDGLQFKQVCTLARLSRPTPEVSGADTYDEIRYAGSSQAQEIRQLLLQYFDREIEQIPYLEEIETLAESNNILIKEDKGNIVGFVIFEKNASTLYLRYWFVRPEYRDRRIGSMLLNRFFYEGRDTRRQMLWVITSNINSLKRYRHYGFTEDGLYDQIYIKGEFTPNCLTTNQLNQQ